MPDGARQGVDWFFGGICKAREVAEHRRFVLVHSPLVGPSTWRWVAASMRAAGHDAVVPSMLGFESSGRPYWPAFVQTLTDACEGDDPLVLVAHSGAGPLLPAAIATLGDRVDRVVFAEASLPPVDGQAELAPTWLLDHLRPLSSDGLLPPWSQWWGDGAMATLVPDPARRALLAAELPTLPFDYLEQAVPVAAGWAHRVAPSVLWFSDIFEPDATDAAGRGWRVRRINGGHLHMAVDPDEVATAIVDLVR
jgi:hypothetical protein